MFNHPSAVLVLVISIGRYYYWINKKLVCFLSYEHAMRATTFKQHDDDDDVVCKLTPVCHNTV